MKSRLRSHVNQHGLLAIENAFTTEVKGFLTPTIAFGGQLQKRLEQIGFSFKTEFRK